MRFYSRQDKYLDMGDTHAKSRGENGVVEDRPARYHEISPREGLRRYTTALDWN